MQNRLKKQKALLTYKDAVVRNCDFCECYKSMSLMGPCSNRENVKVLESIASHAAMGSLKSTCKEVLEEV